MSTDAVIYHTVGSCTPDAVFNGTGLSMMLVICKTLDCANKDMVEPESSITSKGRVSNIAHNHSCLYLSGSYYYCTGVCVGLLLIRDVGCPQGHPLLVSGLPEVGS